MAKDLYCSTLFTYQRKYAEAVSTRWFILSAKYGLVRPDQELCPYEKTLNGAPVKEKKEWTERVWSDLRKELSASDRIIITAGEDYCRYLVPLIESAGHKVELPLKGYAMGYRPGRLRRLTKKAMRIAQSSKDKG